mmetsp:Transcript_3546/g.13578  ORF Transcript_3546/g.13578 Transcript_3546/m.13578 type:complete len:316 (-) Transcript_3546:155-1102(-)|eukprot:CAMPEP_0117451468 /NCGR_PEP_ID=MMETSP0759-20121206/9020_1 /TAXON_ID=63605 /ORGANISM="Percolomonas cosmopolitus, Strain WS" /LENGTH=315 /DNA_ID=CAMNT_0005244063 /DNA_START=379 /DNA_END=1326 /DNA_ORIENTATION=+
MSESSIPTSDIKDLTSSEKEPFVLAKMPRHVYHELLTALLAERTTPMDQQTPGSSDAATTARITAARVPPSLNNKKSKAKTKRYKSNTLNIVSTSSSSDEKNREKIIKGSWTQEEDDILRDLVGKHGPKRWSFIAEHLPHRVGKQCRERWLNHLDPTINKGEWSDLEDKIIVVMQNKMGNRWARISKCLKGRTPNAVKNHWNSTLQKKAEGLRKKYLTVDDPLASFDPKLRKEIERVTHDVQHLSKKEKKKKAGSRESSGSSTTATSPSPSNPNDSLTSVDDEDDDEFQLRNDLVLESLDVVEEEPKRGIRKKHF